MFVMDVDYCCPEGASANRFLKIDHSLTEAGSVENAGARTAIATIVDLMGKASATAQHLRSPVTSAQRLADSDHVVYLLIERLSPRRVSVIGLLKTGWKKLYLFDKAGLQSEAIVYCLLDFYVHESKQRKGYGKCMLDYMLQDSRLDAKHLAIDKPSKKLLQFMWKHYQLSKLVNQGNNFVIYEEFFDQPFDEKNHDYSGNRALSYLHQQRFGRYGAHKHHDTMGDIVHGDNDIFVKHEYDRDVDSVDNQEFNLHPENNVIQQMDKLVTSPKQDLKFHHNSLW